MGVVALKPRLFWPILIFVAVGTAGLMVQGYCLIDEYFSGCILLGGMLAILVRAVSLRKDQGDGLDYLHRWVFLLMVIYMLIESLRGVLLWGDWRIIRWIIYYTMLGIVVFIASKRAFPFPDVKKLSLIVSKSAFLFFGLYLAYGLFSEKFRGVSRFSMQGIEWSGSAYAMFPLVVAMPASIMLLKDNVRIHRWVGWASLGIAIISALFYDSRVSLLVILSYFVISLPKLRLHRVVLFLLLFLVVLGLFSGGGGRELNKKIHSISTQVFESAKDLWSPRKSDLDRYLHMRASFITVSEDWTSLLFGYGVHSHRFAIAPHLKILYAQYLPHSVLRDIMRTTGFTALLVDTGLVGMLLLGLNFLFVGRKILFQKNSPARGVLLLATLFTFLWLLVSNIQDIMLFYLMIMPSGLLVQLNRYRVSE